MRQFRCSPPKPLLKKWLSFSCHRRVARVCSKVRTNPPSLAKFRFFFLVRLRARLVLSSHDVSAAQTKHRSRFEILRPRKSWQARRRTTLSKSICDGTQFYSRVRHRALTCKERCGRGRLRFRQAWNGNGAIDRSFAFPKCFLNKLPATVQGKMAGRVPMANVLRIGGRRFPLCTMRSVSTKCGQKSSVGQLITKPMTNWRRASTTLKENAVSKTHRESVRDAAQLQKEDPSVAGIAWC